MFRLLKGFYVVFFASACFMPFTTYGVEEQIQVDTKRGEEVQLQVKDNRASDDVNVQVNDTKSSTDSNMQRSDNWRGDNWNRDRAFFRDGHRSDNFRANVRFHDGHRHDNFYRDNVRFSDGSYRFVSNSYYDNTSCF